MALFSGVGVEDFIEMCYRGLIRVADGRPETQSVYMEWYHDWKDALSGECVCLLCVCVQVRVFTNQIKPR